PDDFDARGRGIDVLASGPAGARRADHQLVAWDDAPVPYEEIVRHAGPAPLPAGWSGPGPRGPVTRSRRDGRWRARGSCRSGPVHAQRSNATSLDRDNLELPAGERHTVPDAWGAAQHREREAAEGGPFSLGDIELIV